jgi:hypothetical protein
MRYGLRVPGDISYELDEDYEGAEDKKNKPEKSQAKDSQG